MLKRPTDLRLRWLVMSALAGGVMLTGCDQICDRAKRPKEIAETSAGQRGGETVLDESWRNLEAASEAGVRTGGTLCP